MNHTGGRSTGAPVAARTSNDAAAGAVSSRRRAGSAAVDTVLDAVVDGVVDAVVDTVPDGVLTGAILPWRHAASPGERDGRRA
jgi:hypothetical protein